MIKIFLHKNLNFNDYNFYLTAGLFSSIWSYCAKLRIVIDNKNMFTLIDTMINNIFYFYFFDYFSVFV